MIILIAAVIPVFFFFYLWLIRPDTRFRTDCLAFSTWNFAHRGLWNMNEGIPENSLAAFQRALEHKYAIELDVHLTADGQLAVFHDDSLNRMCGIDLPVESVHSEQLSHLRLLHTEYHIPLLHEVLELVNGRVPLLIEMKLPSRNLSLCPLLDRQLRAYSGPYLIESFNSLGLYWYRKHRPDILRGQLTCRFTPSAGWDGFLKKLLSALLVNCVGRPHFIACHHRQANGFGIRLNRLIYDIPLFAWTVRSPEDFAECKGNFHAVIFEGFKPENPQRNNLRTAASDRRQGTPVNIPPR